MACGTCSRPAQPLAAGLRVARSGATIVTNQPLAVSQRYINGVRAQQQPPRAQANNLDQHRA